MEIPDNEQEYIKEEPQYDEQDYNEPEESVEIYSKWAILGFSIFFNTVFGAALLYQNLKDVGYRREALNILLLAVAYHILPWFILAHIPMNMVTLGLVTIGQNIVGGLILSEVFFPRYFPDNDYYPKSIWRVLFKCVIIILLVSMLIPYLVPHSMLPLPK